MKKLDQRGTGIIEVVLTLTIIGVIGFIGWYVWHSKQAANRTLNDTAANSQAPSKITTKTPSDVTQNWQLYTPPGQEYSIRLADGWKLERYQQQPTLSAIPMSNILYKKGVPASVTQVVTGKDSNSMAFVLNYVSSTAAPVSPQGTKQASFTTKQGITVDRYYYIQPEDTPGAYGLAKGSREYSWIATRNSKTITVLHDVQASETDQVAIIEQVIKTVVF